ncbi:caspase family protein [Myxococcota bacterium]|nr:caspase family protein [Myxococcota bacterium]
MKARLAPALALLLASSPALAARLERLLSQEGALDKKDMTLPAGEYAEVFPVDLAAGDRVLIEMESSKFDTYLVLKAPSGQAMENDDLDGDTHQSQIDAIVEESGTWLVYATSARAGEKGKYSLKVSVARGGGSTAVSSSGGGAGSLTLGTPAQGSLAQGDETLANGEWVDTWTVELQAGQQLTLDMTSSDLDTYVGLRSPSGAVDGNDDFGGSRTHSRVERTVEESGTWTVYATTYQAGQGGSYSLLAQVGGGGGASSDGTERWSGSLASGDAVLSSGEYADVVRVEGQAGERWVVDLRSSAFDPFLIVKGPDGTQVENDDFEGAGDRSLVDLTLPASGTWQIATTTYRAGEGGAYDLTLRRVREGEDAGGTQRVTGTLASGDGTLGSGEWFDQATFEGLPGQRVVIDMRGGFDTYLGLVGPGGFQVENDDGESNTHSRIDATLPEAGTYKVVATSYQAGQGGSYTLDITLGQAEGGAAAQRDVVVLQPGVPVSGVLQEGDLTLDSGEYQDGYVIDAQAGQMISVSLASSAFDPYVALQLPDGSFVQNDDWEGRSDLSRVDLQASETGRYRVFATSYRAGVSGAYQVQANLSEAMVAQVAPAPASGQGRTLGVFMGISDYPTGGPTDLAYTADDARAMFAGMQGIGMSPGDGRLLVDGQATRPALQAAINELAGRMGPQDRLVLFYSGHGGRLDRSSPQAADPDGFDETLALYDGEIRDDELAEMLGAVRQGTVLLVLDSCFSGGFSKDVINQPGRMGLFSSHEDVTSAVAAKFRAGGYLARFMVEAIGERLADADTDGALTALELSQYLYERYRSDVKSMPQEKSGAYADIVMTGQNLGYQQIIVDRGGVGPSSVLFAW